MKHEFRAGDLVLVDVGGIFPCEGQDVKRGVVMAIHKDTDKVEIRILNNDLPPSKAYEIHLIPLSLAPFLVEDAQ